MCDSTSGQPCIYLVHEWSRRECICWRKRLDGSLASLIFLLLPYTDPLSSSYLPTCGLLQALALGPLCFTASEITFSTSDSFTSLLRSSPPLPNTYGTHPLISSSITSRYLALSLSSSPQTSFPFCLISIHLDTHVQGYIWFFLISCPPYPVTNSCSCFLCDTYWTHLLFTLPSP